MCAFSDSDEGSMVEHNISETEHQQEVAHLTLTDQIPRPDDSRDSNKNPVAENNIIVEKDDDIEEVSGFCLLKSEKREREREKALLIHSITINPFFIYVSNLFPVNYFFSFLVDKQKQGSKCC